MTDTVLCQIIQKQIDNAFSQNRDIISNALADELGNETTPVGEVIGKVATNTVKTMAELFMLNGIPIVKAENNRVQGHMMMKDLMAPMPLKDPYVRELYGGNNAPATLPGLMIFNTCKGVIGDLQDIQADEDNPNHSCAAARPTKAI